MDPTISCSAIFAWAGSTSCSVCCAGRSGASDVDEEALFDAPYAIIARRNHPLSRKRTLELDDFADYEWILPQQGTPRRLAFERMFQGARRKPKSSIETSKSDLQATLIAASDRITMMSVHEALRLAGGGTTVAPRLPAEGGPRFRRHRDESGLAPHGRQPLVLWRSSASRVFRQRLQLVAPAKRSQQARYGANANTRPSLHDPAVLDRIDAPFERAPTHLMLGRPRAKFAAFR